MPPLSVARSAPRAPRAREIATRARRSAGAHSNSMKANKSLRLCPSAADKTPSRSTGSPTNLPMSRRNAEALNPAKILRREIPVGKLVEHGVHVVDAPVLVVKIVRMLPYVDGQQRLWGLSLGGIGIARLDDLELLAIMHEPCPAASEFPD